MRFLTALVLGVFLSAGPAFAGSTCSLGQSGEHAATLKKAAKALQASNPKLAAQVQAIADNCCKPGSGAGAAKKAVSEHPKSEHPSAGSEHPR